ncbi:MAG: hypothetical protein RR705_07140 [Lachnospiraceae bacterium]
MRDLSSFISILKGLVGLFKDAVLLEQEKLDAAAKNRVTFVEDCMKQEQAVILKLRGFDRNREEQQAALGFKDLSFQQILAACSEEEKELLSPLFTELNEQVSLFQEISNSAKKMIEINLHNIEVLLAQKQNDTLCSYTESGIPADKNKHYTNRTI